jgi:monoamine oxidase
MVLCTVPLGVLKSGSIKFIPELPQRKLDGIKRLGYGLLNKVAMLFPSVFWETDLDTFGHLTDNKSSRGEFFLFYSYATVAGGPVLIALVAGEAAHTFESMPPTDAVTQVIQILKGNIFNFLFENIVYVAFSFLSYKSLQFLEYHICVLVANIWSSYIIMHGHLNWLSFHVR